MAFGAPHTRALNLVAFALLSIGAAGSDAAGPYPLPPMQDNDLEHCLQDGVPMKPHVCQVLRTQVDIEAKNAAAEKAKEDEQSRQEAETIQEEHAKAEAQEAEQARLAALPPLKMYRFERPAPRGQHHWTWNEKDEFGYQRELSPQDRQRGIAAEPLFIVSYKGKTAGVYVFNTTTWQILSCREPCEAMVVGSAAGRQVIPITKGSLLWAIIEDARHGWFTFGPVFSSDPNFKPSE